MTTTVHAWHNFHPFYRKVNIPDFVSSFPGSVYAIQRLATEPTGTTFVTLSGVVAASEIRVYYSDGTEAAGIESCAADQLLTWNVYASGNPLNNVVIRIVHDAYKIKVFNYTSLEGNQSVPVQQDLDKWYRNP